jgi:hypothetical protein
MNYVRSGTLGSGEMSQMRETAEPVLALLSDVREAGRKVPRMNDYTFCPLIKKSCTENRCAWWVEILGKGGCSLRCLGALIHIGLLCDDCREMVKTLLNTIYVKKTSQS